MARPKKWRKKGAKGPNALWIPATRKVVPLSLHSFFREGLHLQLLRVRLKESRTHGSCSDVAFAKAESSCPSPCDRRKFKQDGIAKVFAMLPHLGRALMRPRWRNFAKQKAPTVMRDRRAEQFPKAAAFGPQRLRPRLRDVRDREQANLRFRLAEI